MLMFMKNKESPFGPVSETQFTKDGTPIPKVAPSAQEQAAARAVKETTKDERYQRRRELWDDLGFVYPLAVGGLLMAGVEAWNALQNDNDSLPETPPPATAEPFEYDEDDPYFDDGILPGNPNVPADQDGGTPDNPGSSPAYSTTIPEENLVPEENLGYEDMKPPMGP